MTYIAVGLYICGALSCAYVTLLIIGRPKGNIDITAFLIGCLFWPVVSIFDAIKIPSELKKRR